jgi:hypothetical protein
LDTPNYCILLIAPARGFEEKSRSSCQSPLRFFPAEQDAQLAAQLAAWLAA